MFQTGDLYERSFVTSAGVLDILAEVSVTGRRIDLVDIAVYPRSQELKKVPLPELWRARTEMFTDLALAGFDEARIIGTRLSGAAPGRSVLLVVQLVRRRP